MTSSRICSDSMLRDVLIQTNKASYPHIYVFGWGFAFSLVPVWVGMTADLDENDESYPILNEPAVIPMFGFLGQLWLWLVASLCRPLLGLFSPWFKTPGSCYLIHFPLPKSKHFLLNLDEVTIAEHL